MKRVKTNINSTKEKAIRNAILKELAAVHYINKVAVDVYGKIEYLTKDQVRALQIVAAKLANNDREAFEDFKNNVIVYSGRDITHSTHQMHWTNRGHLGYLKEDFEEGFLSSDYDLLDAFDNAQNDDFMEKFELTYNDILIDDINSSLDELLNSKVLPE